ncbi:MAG: hypothetical protein CMJ39_12440 [Phycisphaerae bacterium]|nr:hypothetical protein [Phycisphaerae bacterium]
MRMIIPIGLLTIAAVPLIGFTEEHPSTVHETVVTTSFTSDDLPAGIPAEFREQLLKSMESGERTSRISLGDMGEMIFEISTDFDVMHGHHHGPDGHDHHGNDHDDSHMIELDLGELSGGQVQGQIVIDLAEMMKRGNRDRDGMIHSDYHVEMVIEDDEGRRRIVRTSRDDEEHRDRNHRRPEGHEDRDHHDDHGDHQRELEMKLREMEMYFERHHDEMGDREREEMRRHMGHLHRELESMHHRGHEDHDDRGRRGDMEQLRERLHEMEMHFERHHEEMDDREREEMRRHMEQLHRELESMHHDGHGDHHDDHEDWSEAREELEHHLHELERHLEENHDHMSEEERHGIMREMEHLHHELEVMHEMDSHEGHDDHEGHEDPFFHMTQEFMHKLSMSGALADTMNHREAVALFGVWMARERMDPERRVQMLRPMMGDEGLYTSVRNAAAWVVMESLEDMDRHDEAGEVLMNIIRHNGSRNPMRHDDRE